MIQGIATYSQVGAQFGHGLGWTMLHSYPLMVVIQAIGATMGTVTGHGIAQNIRRHYPPWELRPTVLLLVAANSISIGADLAALGAAPRMSLDSDHAMALVAVLRTTVSPYLFFWQAAEEVEELHRRHLKRLAKHAKEALVESCDWGQYYC